jgi:ApbE superfamily uncharacterized protein (UPF0280 family)
MARSRTQGDNQHLEDLTSAEFVHVTASETDKVIRSGASSLLRVILNTNGGTVTLRNGDSDVIGIIASDSPEGTFNYGIFCPNGIQVDTGSTVDCTIVVGD